MGCPVIRLKLHGSWAPVRSPRNLPAEGLQISKNVKILDNTEEVLWSRSVNSTSDKEVYKGCDKIKLSLWGKKLKSRISVQFHIQSPGQRQAEIQFQCEKEETEQKGATFSWQDQRNLLGQDAVLHLKDGLHLGSNGDTQFYHSVSFPRHVPGNITFTASLHWI